MIKKFFIIFILFLCISSCYGTLVSLNQLNTTQDFNSKLHGVIAGTEDDDVPILSQIYDSLTTGLNITLDNNSPKIIHVGNVSRDQKIIMSNPLYNKDAIYTIAFDTYSSHLVVVNGHINGTASGNVYLTNTKILQLLSNGTTWRTSVFS
jgi:hypothetical protein